MDHCNYVSDGCSTMSYQCSCQCNSCYIIKVLLIREDIPAIIRSNLLAKASVQLAIRTVDRWDAADEREDRETKLQILSFFESQTESVRTSRDILEHYASSQGWDDDTIIDLLCGYIDELAPEARIGLESWLEKGKTYDD